MVSTSGCLYTNIICSVYYILYNVHYMYIHIYIYISYNYPRVFKKWVIPKSPTGFNLLKIAKWSSPWLGQGGTLVDFQSFTNSKYIYIWYIYIYKVLYNIPMLSPVDSPERPSWTLASVPRTSETSPGCIARATASNSWILSLENPWKSMENPWGIMENHGTSMEHYGKMIDKCLKSWKHYFISSNVMKIPLKSMAVFVGALDLNSIYLVYPGRVIFQWRVFPRKKKTFPGVLEKPNP